MSPSIPTVQADMPDNAPLTVRLSPLRHAFGTRRNETVLTLLLATGASVGGPWLLGRPDETLHDARYGDMDSHLVGYLALAVGAFFLIYLVASLLISVRRPALAADDRGVYIRPNLDRKRVLYLPWE